MAFQQRDKSGSLWKNLRKEKETHPDYTGRCLIDGQDWNISAWIKEARDGSKFMSLSFRPFQTEKREEAPVDGGGIDDEIPF